MNIGESQAVSTLLRWITRTPGRVSTIPPVDEEARGAAAYLADRAYKTQAAGMRSAEVRERWPAEPPNPTGLNDEDLRVLRKMANIPCDSPRCNCDQWRREIADFVRQEAPELTDAALTRVLLPLGGVIAHYAHENKLSGRQAAGLIQGAAVELAALEIGNPSQ